jgi:hypothetical protein
MSKKYVFDIDSLTKRYKKEKIEYILETRKKEEDEEKIEAISTDLNEINKLEREASKRGLITEITTCETYIPKENKYETII